MTPHPKLPPTTAVALAVAGTVLIAVVDWLTTNAINVAVFYVSIIVLLAWTDSLRLLWGGAVLTAALTILIVGRGETIFGAKHTWVEDVNRYLTAGMLVVTAAFVHLNLVLTRQFVTETTQRERAEDALRQTQEELSHVSRVTMLGELGASIAHEVSQPLSGVLMNGNASLRWLAANPPNLDEAREALGRIVRDGNRANAVILRIRTLLKKTAVQKTRLDLNEAIGEVVALAQSAVDQKQATLRTDLARDLPAVLGDRVQLQQVLLNLILNALDAMGGVRDRPRELFIGTRAQPAGAVRVTVRDTGVGFGASDPAKLFDAFYTTKEGGMGMGLSISRSIVESHDGQLGALAHDGDGATFWLEIPAISR